MTLRDRRHFTQQICVTAPCLHSSEPPSAATCHLAVPRREHSCGQLLLLSTIPFNTSFLCWLDCARTSCTLLVYVLYTCCYFCYCRVAEGVFDYSTHYDSLMVAAQEMDAAMRAAVNKVLPSGEAKLLRTHLHQPVSLHPVACGR